MNLMFILFTSLISLNACSSMTGNVIPEKGPSMEQVYDSMEQEKPAESVEPVLIRNTQSTFQKLPNPELKMYVYPHLAGHDEIPIPGYYTVFNAYTQDHYALPLETTRE